MSTTMTAAAPTNGAALAPPRRFGVGILALASAASLLAGLAVAALVLTLGLGPWTTSPGDSSAEAGFARDMSLHHAQAVEMGMIASQRAELPEVQSLGGDIALTQQAQIGMMQQWLRDWGLLPTSTEPPMEWMPSDDHAHGVAEGLMPGMATPDEMASLRSAEGIEVDRIFLDLMITHHVGGIHMVDGVLEVSSDEDVRFLASAMKDGQQKELQVLRDLQAAVATAAD